MKTYSLATTTDLGHLIRATRIASELSLAEAAALCGVSPPFLGQLENGKSGARIGLILQVCEGLGIELVATPPIAIDIATKRRRRQRRVTTGPKA